MGAELAVADADAVVAGEVLGDVAGEAALDDEGDDADAGVVGAPEGELADAGDGGEAVAEAGDQALLLVDQGGPAGGGQRVAGGGDGEGAEDVGGAGLVAGLGVLMPFALGGADRTDRAAALEVGVGALQPVAAADQDAGAEGRVELVAGEGDVVEVERGEVELAMRDELGGVDQDAGAVAVRDVGEGGDRPELAGHVGGGGDDQQRGAVDLGQGGVHGADGLAGEGGRGQADDSVPGEQAGVVLGVEGDHGGALGERPGQQVRGVGGVAGEDDRVVGAGSGEGADGVAGLLVACGGELGGVARAAVHAGVGGQGGGDGRADRLQTGGAGGVVEVGVLDQASAPDRDFQVGAEHGGDLRFGAPGGGRLNRNTRGLGGCGANQSIRLGRGGVIRSGGPRRGGAARGIGLAGSGVEDRQSGHGSLRGVIGPPGLRPRAEPALARHTS